MWIAEMKDGRFQYFKRYKDPYSEKNKTKSTILTSKSPQERKKAQRVLDSKITHALDEREQQLITFHQVYKESYKSHMSSLRPFSIVVYESVKKQILIYVDHNISIGKMDVKYLQKFSNQLNYSDQYVSTFKSTLGLVLKYAHQMEYIDKNPLDNIVLLKKLKH